MVGSTAFLRVRRVVTAVRTADFPNALSRTQAVVRSALVFRGWGYEADCVLRQLAEAGIGSELKESFVPAADGGGGVLVCEVFVHVDELENARRAIAPLLSKRTFI